jgi:hypothetical protein
MTPENIREQLGIEPEIEHLNPLEQAEHWYFGSQGHSSSTRNYREQAIELCVKKKASFTSTCNSVYNLFGKFIKAACPKCKRNMEQNSGSGCGGAHTINYKCNHCDIQTSITCPSDGISIQFPCERAR